MGMDAITQSWQEIQKMSIKKIKLQQLELLVTFIFLLPEKDQTKVHAITAEVYKLAGDILGSSPGPSSQPTPEASSSSSKPSKTKGVVSSVSEAAQMFK